MLTLLCFILPPALFCALRLRLAFGPQERKKPQRIMIEYAKALAFLDLVMVLVMAAFFGLAGQDLVDRLSGVGFAAKFLLLSAGIAAAAPFAEKYAEALMRDRLPISSPLLRKAILIQAVVLLVLAGAAVKRPVEAGVSGFQMQFLPDVCNCIYDEKGVIMFSPPEDAEEPQRARVAWWETGKLPSGAYQVTVNYESVSDPDDPSHSLKDAAGSITITSDRNSSGISFSEAALKDSERQLHTMLWLQTGYQQDGLAVNVIYNGTGTLNIHSIQLREYLPWRLTRILGFLLLFVLFDLAWVYFSQDAFFGLSPKSKAVVGALTAMIAVSSIILFSDLLCFGHDCEIHLLRIAAVADNLKIGVFPGRIYPNLWNGYGYIMPQFYCELFLYPSAILYLMGLPLQAAYQFYLLLLNAGACLMSYFCVKAVTQSRRLGLVGAFLYTFAAYRLVVVYVRAAFGEATAMVFYPLVLYGFWRVYAKDARDLRWTDALPVVFGLSGIIESHVLSCEMVGLFIIGFVLAYAQKTLELRRFVLLSGTLAVTLLLNSWFIVPFLQGRSLPLNINQTKEWIGERGAQLWQVFMPFHKASGDDLFVSGISGARGEMPMPLGAALTLGLVLFLFCCLKKTEWRLAENRWFRQAVPLFIMAGVSLLLTLFVFPWDAIQGYSVMLDELLSVVQFPWRYLATATVFCVFLTVFCLKIIEEKKGARASRLLMLGLLIAAFVPECLFFTQYADATSDMHVRTENDITPIAMDMLYLPLGTNPSLLTVHEPKIQDGGIIREYAREERAFRMDVENPTQDVIWVLAPLQAYEHYHAYTEDGGELAILPGENNCISVLLPPASQGRIRIVYREPALWRVCEAVSLLTLAALALAVRRSRRTAPRPGA